MSGRDEYAMGSVTFSPAHAPAIIQSMAESICDLVEETHDLKAQINELKLQLAKREVAKMIKTQIATRQRRSKK